MTKPDDDHAPSILLVDDTVENLRLLAGMLATRGFDARPVTSGRDALEAMSSEMPDLVLLDVTMPDMDGFEVCARIRERPEWRGVPVIFLTALTDVSDKVKGFAVGGTDYITKPFQLEEVLARVSNQLAVRNARRELEVALTQLRELEALRDDLVRMIVHDMRSPLTAVLMNLELMRMDATGEFAASLDDAIASAQTLNQLANTMLDVSRLEEGKMPLTLAQTDLSPLASEVVATMAALDRKRRIEVLSSGPAVAACDAGLIRRVLENLISNAVKHTPEGGAIRVSLGMRDTRICVAVEDEGAGVPPELRERIFEKFGSSTARQDKRYHSVGLGLAFCKLAVEAHGGTIGVSSRDPRGSIFAFEIPADATVQIVTTPS